MLLPWSLKEAISSGDFLLPLWRPPCRWAGSPGAHLADATLTLSTQLSERRNSSWDDPYTVFPGLQPWVHRFVCPGLTTCWAFLWLCGGTGLVLFVTTQSMLPVNPSNLTSPWSSEAFMLYWATGVKLYCQVFTPESSSSTVKSQGAMHWPALHWLASAATQSSSPMNHIGNKVWPRRKHWNLQHLPVCHDQTCLNEHRFILHSGAPLSFCCLARKFKSHEF